MNTSAELRGLVGACIFASERPIDIKGVTRVRKRSLSDVEYSYRKFMP